MTYETYRLIFIIGAAMAGLMFALAVVLFFVLKIPRVIGDLSGATARKAIEDIRSQNTESGDKVHKSSAVNKQRGRVTDKIGETGVPVPKHSGITAGAMGTEKLHTQQLANQAAESMETSLLDEPASETTLLSANGMQDQQYSETVLSAPVAPPAPQFSETTVLTPAFNPMPQPVEAAPFTIEYELTYVHSDERIV